MYPYVQYYSSNEALKSVSLCCCPHQAIWQSKKPLPFPHAQNDRGMRSTQRFWKTGT